MYETHYHRAKDVPDAVRAFTSGKDARYLSGGQTLIPTMKQRLAAPSDVIDISRLDALKGVSVSGGALVVGAATTHATVATSAEVAKAISALAVLAGLIGDPAVRHRGTIGGSLANNDPAADYPAGVLALGATIHTDKRTIAADDFFTGLFSTALGAAEIITKVSFPIPKKAAYQKFHQPASRFALTGVFVVVNQKGEVRAAATGAGAKGVFRVTDFERALATNFSPDAIENIKADPSGLLSDIHASAAYRANLVKVMAQRAVAAAGA